MSPRDGNDMLSERELGEAFLGDRTAGASRATRKQPYQPQKRQLTSVALDDEKHGDTSNADRGGERDKEPAAENDTGRQNDKDSKPDEEKASDENEDDGGDDGKKTSRWPIVLLIVVVVLILIGGGIYWFVTRNDVSTDDAYTEGDAVAIAPHVSGYVTQRLVDDNQFVRTGDLMLRIDPRDYINARDQARANLDLARAQLRSAEIDLVISRVRYPSERKQSAAQLDQARANQFDAGREYHRQRTVDQRATTQSTVDQATAQFRSTTDTMKVEAAQLEVSSLVGPNLQSSESTVKQRQATVEQAVANLAQAELNLSYTYIRAPQDGTVTQRNVYVGTYAQVGQQVFYVTSPLTWIVANFKETQLNRMRVGQHVTIHVDAFPGLKLHGHVDSFQQGSGARFTTFPSENATGNYVKIVRRLPVKIIIDNGIDPQRGLPLGLSVEPTVDVQ